MYVQLTCGAYTARALEAAAQRCVNLYPEQAPPESGEPFSFAHNATPGLTLLSQAPGDTAPIRGLYTAGNGNVYGVALNKLYHIDQNFVWNIMGTMLPSSPQDAAQLFTPVSMTDNGVDLLIADGSVDGWTANCIANNGFARINSLNQIVTGTVTNPVVTANTTVIIDTVIVTLGLTDTSLTGTITAINAANITNITAYASATNQLVIRDATGTEIIVGPGTANTALGLTDGTYGVQDPGGWLGSNRVDYTDTYFICAQPNSTLWYCSQADSTAFDALDFVNRSAKTDPIQVVVVTHRVLLIMGTQTTEIWWNSGGAQGGVLSNNTFPFQEFPNTLIQKGVGAIYSVAQINNVVFFLAADVSGDRQIYMIDNGNAARISTFAIENELSKYSIVSDAIGSVYQQDGHNFYVLSFPTGDATWCYDATTNQWHERVSIDSNGEEHQWRGRFTTMAYGKVICADFENANLYELDLNNYTENGNPVKRVRSFPHQVDMQANRRVIFNQFIANMTVGTGLSSGTGTQDVVAANFTAPDGTPITDYTGAIGGGFTPLPDATTTGIIFDDGFTGNSVGNAAYFSQGTPLSADYTLTWTVSPESYLNIANSTIYVVARSPNTATSQTPAGYLAAVTGNSVAYTLSLAVEPTGNAVNCPMGNLAINTVYNLTMALSGNYISVSAQRSADGLWLTKSGVWQGTPIAALGLHDSTYTQAGSITIGGNWGGNALNIAIYNISTYNSGAVYA